MNVYKSVHGEEGYNLLLVRLINKMTGSSKNGRMAPSSAAASSRDGTVSLLDKDKGE